MIEYTSQALSNRDLFYEDNQKYIMYVEDQGKEYIYESILERMFTSDFIGNIKILGLGGKSRVKNKYKENKKESKKNKIYLVDGDFDLLLNNDVIVDDNFIYLDRYNIESYFIDENALVRCIRINCGLCSGDVKTKLNFQSWKSQVYNCLENLFILYLIVQYCSLNIPNVSEKVFKYLDGQGLINNQKIILYEKNVRENVISFEEVKYECIEKYKKVLKENPEKLICGKYLLESLRKYVNKTFDSNIHEEEFKKYMIENFDLKVLDFMKNKIGKICD